MNEPAFPHDVFLSHSSKDKAVVRPLAERLRADALKVPFEPRLRTSDSGLPLGPLRFRDRLNKERRSLSKLRPSTFAPRTSIDAPIEELWTLKPDTN